MSQNELIVWTCDNDGTRAEVPRIDNLGPRFASPIKPPGWRTIELTVVGRGDPASYEWDVCSLPCAVALTEKELLRSFADGSNVTAAAILADTGAHSADRDPLTGKHNPETDVQDPLTGEWHTRTSR